jgi:lupus La protein
MRRFQPISAVVAALRESNFLEVTGPEGQEQVKRKVAYDPSSGRSKSESRSVYVKGFGDEEPSSQFDIEAFFAPYGPTNAVRLRRTPEKLFKGSVFVEFVDDETAQKFLALEPKPLWKGKHPLIIQSKKEYMDQKEQEIKDGKLEPAETWAPGRGRGHGRGRGGRGGSRGERGHYRNDRDGRGRGDSKGDRDPDDWKKRREEDRASGFRDNHRRNDRGRRDGDRDRKGRGGRRNDRGPHNDERNREREEKDRYVENIFIGKVCSNQKTVRSKTSHPRRLRMTRSDLARMRMVQMGS